MGWIIAMANEIISTNSVYNGIINSLLGRIAIADNIDSATFIAKNMDISLRLLHLMVRCVGLVYRRFNIVQWNSYEKMI